MLKKIFSVFVLLTILIVAARSEPRVQAEGDVEKAALEIRIQNKAQELDALNRELAAKQKELSTTKNERASLQRELSTLEKNIAQLQLSIRTDEVSVEKLSLEIDSLTYDIRDIEHAVESKSNAVGKLIGEIHQRDATSPLITFLESASIAETISETEAIRSLKGQLRTDIVSLVQLKDDMNDKLQNVSDKKDQVELRKRTQLAKKAIVEDQKQVRRVVLSETKNKESVYEKQLADLKKQQDVLSDEIEAIENELRKRFDTSQLQIGSGIFVWPVQLTSQGGKGTITQHFGVFSSLYRGKAHNGLDIGAPMGTPVYAVAEGTVSAVGNNDQSGTRKYQYGKHILIRHSNNLTSLYAHLSQQVVSTGTTVKRGQLIGYVGNTGYSTGPHLHLGVYFTPSVEMKSLPPAAGLVPVGVTVKPEDYL